MKWAPFRPLNAHQFCAESLKLWITQLDWDASVSHTYTHFYSIRLGCKCVHTHILNFFRSGQCWEVCRGIAWGVSFVGTSFGDWHDLHPTKPLLSKEVWSVGTSLGSWRDFFEKFEVGALGLFSRWSLWIGGYLWSSKMTCQN